MKKFLKYFYGLVEKGWASVEEKAYLLKTAEDEGVEDDVKDEIEEADKLPDDDPEDGDGAGKDKDKDKDDDEDEDEEDAQKMLQKLLSIEVTKMEKTLGEKYDAKLKKDLAAHKELLKKKAGLYNTEIKKDRKAVNEWTRKFIVALRDNDYSSVKDLSSGTDNKGGYLVDEELNAEIQHLVTEYGVARREMTSLQLTKTLKLNNLATDVSVFWTTETTAKTSSDIVIGQVTLELAKMAVIVPMSDELLEDSEIDLVSFLTGRIAEAMSQKEDEAFFNGTGAAGFGGFTGLLNNTSANVVTMTGTAFSGIDADDLIDMQDATPQGALRNAKYYMHRTIMSFVRKLKATDGTYIYQAPSQTGPATIWGFPVVLVEAMPAKTATAADTDFVIFGDLKKAAWLGFKNGLRIKLSDQAVVRNTADDADINLFRQDMTALRVVERVGFVVVIATAYTKLTTAAASA